MRKASLLFRTVQQRLDGVNGVIQENLTGIRLIRVFVRMGYEIERFTVFSGNLMRSTVSALRLTETTMPFVMLIVNAAILAILWFGRIAISNGDATLGQTVAVINYSLRTIGALSAISGLVVTFSALVPPLSVFQKLWKRELEFVKAGLCKASRYRATLNLKAFALSILIVISLSWRTFILK